MNASVTEVTSLKLQKNVEYNSQLPYNVIKSDVFDYRFTTKDGINYRAYFINVSYLHPSFTEAYSFNIEPEGDISSTHHPLDIRIGRTIAFIFDEFFEKNENSMLMACDNTDGREEKRRLLFDRWYDIYSNNKLIKLDASMINESYRLYVSIYINKNNPNKEKIIDAFNELVKTDLYELGL